MTPRQALVAAALLALAACSTSSSGTTPFEAGAGLGSRCMGSSDCPAPYLCGFPLDGGCAATGICVKDVLSQCTDGPTVCGCDGLTPVLLNCTYGPGVAPAPIPSLTPGCSTDGGEPTDGNADGGADSGGDSGADSGGDAGAG